MKIKLLVSLASALTLGTLCGVPASASPMFWTDSTKTTPLRDLKTPPRLTPDVLEFANQGPVRFSTESSTGKMTVACNQVELGAAVVVNNDVEETMLSIPFGVFEGDQCVGSTRPLVPTHFHTLPPWLGVGAVGTVFRVTKITVTGNSAPFTATIHYMTISQDLGDKFCVWNFDLIRGVIANATEGFVEEAPPNLSLKFPAVEVPVRNAAHSRGCPKAGTFSADFLFLETMSTATDTAFVG
jgi:hypothetical protein